MGGPTRRATQKGWKRLEILQRYFTEVVFQMGQNIQVASKVVTEERFSQSRQGKYRNTNNSGRWGNINEGRGLRLIEKMKAR